MLSNARFVMFVMALSSAPALAETKKDQPRPVANAANGPADKANMLTNERAWKTYENYLAGWNEVADDRRAKLAADVVAENVEYRTPRHELGGRATLIEDMAAFQKRLPKGHIEIGDVSAHHDVALLTWVLVQADGTVFARGHDQMRVSPDGKITQLITFARPTGKP